MKGVKITKTGQIFYKDFLRGKIEPTEYSYELARLLTWIKQKADEEGIAQISDRLPVSMTLAYDSLLENGLIKETKVSIVDEIENLVERRWKRKDKEDQFKMGFGPPPMYGIDEEDY